LVFASGETKSSIRVPLLPFESKDRDTNTLAFRLMLSNPTGGVILGTRCDCRVVILPGKKLKVGHTIDGSL
jgi:hypothetical protein